MSQLISTPIEYCLKIIGFWPDPFYNFGPRALLLTLLTFLPFQIWNITSLMEESLLLMDSLSDIFAETLIFIKFFIMWSKRRQIKTLLKEILNEWNIDFLPEKWKLLASYSRKFYIFNFSMYLVAGALYYPDIVIAYINEPVQKRKLLFPAKYPFNSRPSPTYEIINMVQLAQALLLATADSLSQTLLVALVVHVCARIELLQEDVNDFSQSCIKYVMQNEIRSRSLNRIVKEHYKILTLVDQIDIIYSYVSLFQISLSTVIICVTGYVLVTAMENANVILLMKFSIFIVTMSIQAFSFCFAGQYLRNKGESIIDMMYNCLWYAAEPNEIKMISLMLLKAQVPLTLSGGQLFELSASTFTIIVKTAASYLSVLRAVYA